MGRRQYEVKDEIARRWCERHRQGDSFTKIAADEGVERRLVARIVRQFNKQEYLEEGTALRREIRSELFREHLQKMEKAAWWLLEFTGYLSLRGCCVIPPNEAISFERPNTESALANKIKTMLVQSRKEKITSSVDYIDDELRNRVFQREAKAVVEDLKTHLPDLWEKVNIWEEEAAKYLKRWKILDEHARSKGIPSHLFATGIREAQHLLVVTDEEESFPPGRDTFQTPQDVGLWLFRNPAIREALMKIGDSHNRLKVAFTQLEGVLIPSEVRYSLLERECVHCPVP